MVWITVPTESETEVREYTEGNPVVLVIHNGRICLRATNEGGNNEIILDFLDILALDPARVSGTTV